MDNQPCLTPGVTHRCATLKSCGNDNESAPGTGGSVRPGAPGGPRCWSSQTLMQLTERQGPDAGRGLWAPPTLLKFTQASGGASVRGSPSLHADVLPHKEDATCVLGMPSQHQARQAHPQARRNPSAPCLLPVSTLPQKHGPLESGGSARQASLQKAETRRECQ